MLEMKAAVTKSFMLQKRTWDATIYRGKIRRDLLVRKTQQTTFFLVFFRGEAVAFLGVSPNVGVTESAAPIYTNILQQSEFVVLGRMSSRTTYFFPISSDYHLL